MNRRKIIFFLFFFILLIAAFFAYRVYQAVFASNTKFSEEKVVLTIKTGTNFDAVKTQITPYIKNVQSFTLIAEQKKYTENVKAGKYAISNGMNNNEIINSLRSNNIPVTLTFNNQGTFEKLAGAISKQIEADSISLLKAFKDLDFIQENAFTEDAALAMYIPNTYEFFWNTNAVDFRKRMLKEYKSFWSGNRNAKAAKLGMTAIEVISLAAIVHEETKKIDERPRVAGVYLNRIKRKMLLQADPTLIYGLKKHTGNFDLVIKRVLNKDKELDSPYNTYKYLGVPPGPISMPDISAIDAVLNAEQHDYLFFVADVENFGYHKFARNLRQHNVYKRQYINWLNAKNIKR